MNDLVILDDTKESRFLIAGDSSFQESPEYNYLIYAVIAIEITKINQLSNEVTEIIKQNSSGNCESELHAKNIWNGHARKKTGFSGLQNKNQMKDFFWTIGEVISKYSPLISVSVIPIKKKEVVESIKGLKATLAYSALSRLDGNISESCGEHIWKAPFFIDPESEKMMSVERGILTGLLREITMVENFDFSNPKFRYRIDPVYKPIDSKLSIPVQIADMVAYVVGKYLIIAEQVESEMKSSPNISENLIAKIEDANFLLSVWLMMDIEVVSYYESFLEDYIPDWLKRALVIYKPYLQENVFLNISIRESLSCNREKKEVLNGIGFFGTLSKT